MKVLIITKFFTPERSIAAVRWTKIAKYLKKEHGYEIYVLTEKRNFDVEGGLPIKIKKDHLLEKDLKWVGRYMEVPMGAALRILFWTRNRMQKNVGYKESLVYLQEKHNGLEAGLKKSFVVLVQDLIDYLWSRQAIRKLNRIKKMHWDVVISSCGPFWVHRAAEFLKKRNKNIKWIADFRDDYPTTLNTKLFFEIEKRQAEKHCKLADYVFRVNDTMYTNTPENIPKVTITNGFDIEEKQSPLRPKKFNIVYTGSMYHDTFVEPLFRAVDELIKEEAIRDNEICIDFYGGRGNLIRDQVKKFEANRFYTHHGLVDRDTVIKYQQTAAILVQMGRNDEETKAAWSGKMYEYMMSKKPIIFLVSGDIPYSIPSKYMNTLGGYCYEQCRDDETFSGLKKYILDKYHEWKTTGNVSIYRDEKFVNQFSYSCIASKVAEIIEEG